VLQAYLPIGGIGSRTRQQLIVAVSEARGVRSIAWVNGSWLELLGATDPDDALSPLFDYARACAEAGAPLDATALSAAYPRSVIRSVRATVAVAHLGSALAGSAEELWTRTRTRRWGSSLDVATSVVGGSLALPWLVPSMAVAGAARVLARLAPSLPPVELPPATEANLVVHLLAEAAPSYLGHVLVRTGVAMSPVPVSIAFRMDGTAATIRLGRGRVAITNGIAPSVIAVVDGGVEPLVQLVAGSILKDLGMPVRRP
jgi:hypothetical protein